MWGQTKRHTPSSLCLVCLAVTACLLVLLQRALYSWLHNLWYRQVILLYFDAFLAASTAKNGTSTAGKEDSCVEKLNFQASIKLAANTASPKTKNQECRGASRQRLPKSRNQGEQADNGSKCGRRVTARLPWIPGFWSLATDLITA